MKKYLFEPFDNGIYLDIKVDGKLKYRWPLTSPDRRFTTHLLSRLLSPIDQYRVLVLRMKVLALVPDKALDFYLPPAYRPLPRNFLKQSLWDRFINLFKKEKRHARTQHNRRTQ